jgi:hypothetical protein
MLAHPLLDRWWESGVSAFSPEFKEKIDSARLELGDSVWTYQPRGIIAETLDSAREATVECCPIGE